MRYFIDRKNDLWTALENNNIIIDQYKPKPYKNYRELTNNEEMVIRIKDHFYILFHGDPDYKIKVRQSLVNLICELLPELALKHNLVEYRQYEYWRK